MDGEEFHERVRREAEKAESTEAYEAFTEKFKPKLTTDDCFTPPEIYEAVKTWAVEEYGWEGREIIRPFYPGGDYVNEKYPDGCVIIDNPPFSLESEIVRFYEARGIDYFLFSNDKTTLNIKAATSRVCVGVGITYENGANVNTSFVCSRGPGIRTAPSLFRIVDRTNKELAWGRRKNLPVYQYPPEVITMPKLDKWSELGVDYQEDYFYITGVLDAQRAVGKGIFGAGALVPREAKERAEREAKERAEREAKERAEREAKERAEREAKERAERTTVWRLSPREEEIVRDLEERKAKGGMVRMNVIHPEHEVKQKAARVERQLDLFRDGLQGGE